MILMKDMKSDEIIIGRGGTDQEGGNEASMVYAGKIIKDLGLEDDYTLISNWYCSRRRL